MFVIPIVPGAVLVGAIVANCERQDVFAEALATLTDIMPQRKFFGCRQPAVIITDKCKKTAVYTNINGDIVSHTSKTAKIKNGDISQHHIGECQCVAE